MYTYDPKTNSFTFPASTMQRIIRRLGQTKEKCVAEDDRENADKIRATRDKP